MRTRRMRRSHPAVSQKFARRYHLPMRLLRVAALIALAGCSGRQQQNTLFTDVAAESGITFRNTLTFTERLNPYTYRNFYNGAGVAVGDINNDGLQDIYFAANQAGNRLYLNKGNF